MHLCRGGGTLNILIDECLPRYVKTMLHEYTVYTVQDMGWSGIKNGDLLALAEPQFNVFLTADKNLRYQQNLQSRRLAIVVFPSNRLSIVKTLGQVLTAALEQVASGAYIEL
jgi:predicted nuclease of predicted toxin-antitoxin system